jgi:hypothetical protein
MKKLRIFIGIILVIVCAWSPWVTKDNVTEIVENRFASLWRNVTDNPHVVGLADITKIPFGIRAVTLYAGGLGGSIDEKPHRGETVFISFLGTVHGLSSPDF